MMIPKGVKMACYLIAIVGLMCVASSAAIIYVNENSQENFSITYDMDGGVNAYGNPDRYSVNKVVEFKTPTKDGCIFDGWFKDDSMKTKVKSTEGLSGDLTLHAKWHTKATYSIEYELNGGVNSPENPDSYLEDSAVNLRHPFKNDCVFIGWHFKSDLSDRRVDYISRDQNSDVCLYAEWEYDRSGYTYHYDNSGTYKIASDWKAMDIEGTTSYTYLNYTYDNGYHIKCTEKNNIFSDTTAEWSNARDNADWEYIGEYIVIFEGDEKKCKVFQADIDGETWCEYIGEDDIIYYMTRYCKESDEFGDTVLDMAYTYTGRTVAEIKDQYSVTIYNDEGIVTKGTGVYNALSSITLTADAMEGYHFGGWYNEDGSLAKDQDIVYIDMIVEDIVLYAQNSLEYDLNVTGSFTLRPAEGIENVEWTVYDQDKTVTFTGDELTYEFEKAGSYIITYSGTERRSNSAVPYCGMYRVMSEGMVAKPFVWTYNGVQYQMDLEIAYEDYEMYKSMPTERCRTYHVQYGKLIFEDDHTAEFVVIDDYITKIADWFKTEKLIKGWSDLQTASCILSFVQSIPYVSDLYSKGMKEYWKYPVETLYEGCGDCEDTSFLYCAIAKAMGYQTALLLFSGHMAASVNVTGAYGTEFTYLKGNTVYRFYYCETTGTGWNVGESPPGYNQNGLYYNEKVYGTPIGATIPI